jgi:hypothetical protein
VVRIHSGVPRQVFRIPCLTAFRRFPFRNGFFGDVPRRYFMMRGFQGTDHAWLVMMEAVRALTRYAADGIEETGLGLSDFGVL